MDIDLTTARTICLDLIEESALAAAQVIAAHRFDDEAIWKLMRYLDAARRRCMKQLDETGGREHVFGDHPIGSAHPAIEELLLHVQRDRRQTDQPQEAR